MTRIAFQTVPNAERLVIHVEKKLPRIGYFSSDKLTADAQRLNDSILAIEGITEVSTHKDYSMTVQRGGVFAWEELRPKVTEALRRFLCVQGFEEVAAFPEYSPPWAECESILAEQARWQEAIYKTLVSQVDDPSVIDGGGCDSGDPLDFTLAEIHHAFNAVKHSQPRTARKGEES